MLASDTTILLVHEDENHFEREYFRRRLPGTILQWINPEEAVNFVRVHKEVAIAVIPDRCNFGNKGMRCTEFIPNLRAIRQDLLICVSAKDSIGASFARDAGADGAVSGTKDELTKAIRKLLNHVHVCG